VPPDGGVAASTALGVGDTAECATDQVADAASHGDEADAGDAGAGLAPHPDCH
jgi:hypothetical protein